MLYLNTLFSVVSPIFLKINLGISTFQLFTAMLDPLTLRSNL